jgi:hypothetical protein
MQQRQHDIIQNVTHWQHPPCPTLTPLAHFIPLHHQHPPFPRFQPPLLPKLLCRTCTAHKPVPCHPHLAGSQRRTEGVQVNATALTCYQTKALSTGIITSSPPLPTPLVHQVANSPTTLLPGSFPCHVQAVHWPSHLPRASSPPLSGVRDRIAHSRCAGQCISANMLSLKILANLAATPPPSTHPPLSTPPPPHTHTHPSPPHLSQCACHQCLNHRPALIIQQVNLINDQQPHQ